MTFQKGVSSLFSMEKIQTAGLIHGNYFQYIDHIAPLCIVMGIPLIVTEIEIKNLIKKYYPMLSCIYMNYTEMTIKIPSTYSVIFSSHPNDIFHNMFAFSTCFFKQSLLNIWCPHGNSDKGHSIPFMEALKSEKIALMYGQKMIDFTHEKKAFSHIDAVIETGNYRYQLYKESAPFYDDFIEKEVKTHLVKGHLTLLFAPTWSDLESSSSIFDALPLLLKTIPDHWNLIIKPHPNTLQDTLKIVSIKKSIKDRPNILLLKHFPPIYPLLNCIDAYLGDMSSIGYDCLPFQKPLFFLNQNKLDPKVNKGLYLFKCGKVIEPHDYKNIFPIIEMHFEKKNKTFQKNHKEVNHYVFGKEKKLNHLRQEIEQTYTRYLKGSMAPA